MKEDIKQFLASTLLEEYVLGSIDPARISEVEDYIRNSEEVKSAYEELQENLELLATKVAAPPPLGTKENILSEIDKHSDLPQKKTNYQKWWAVAASIAAVTFCLFSMYQAQTQKTLTGEIKSLNEQYVNLQNECGEREKEYAQQREQWQLLDDVSTEKYAIVGNKKAAGLETVAYWNKEKKRSYLSVLSLPKIPKDKCLQLWADVDGEMISVEIIPDKKGELVAIPFKEYATSLNITIEPQGGSAHPTLANLVASVSI